MQTRSLLWELLEVLYKKGALPACLAELSDDAIAVLAESEWSLPLDSRYAVLMEAGRRKAGAARADRTV